MTINLFCATKDFAVCVADRRLTLASGAIASDRARKILNVACKDARLIAAFNGFAGTDLNGSPIDWLVRCTGIGDQYLVDLIETVKTILARGLRGVSPELARLSFTLVGFWQGRPVLVHISNYEFLQTNRLLSSAAETMEAEWFTDGFVCAQTGSYSKEKEAELSKTFRKIREQGATSDRVRKMFLKAARDIPFTGNRDGVVGANCHSVILDAARGYVCNLHTLGGSTVLEFPSFVGPSSTFSQIMVDSNPGKDGPAWGHPEKRVSARLRDRTCRTCRNPLPPGQRQCGICDARITKG